MCVSVCVCVRARAYVCAMNAHIRKMHNRARARAHTHTHTQQGDASKREYTELHRKLNALNRCVRAGVHSHVHTHAHTHTLSLSLSLTRSLSSLTRKRAHRKAARLNKGTQEAQGRYAQEYILNRKLHINSLVNLYSKCTKALMWEKVCVCVCVCAVDGR